MGSIKKIAHPSFIIDAFELRNICCDDDFQNVIVELHNQTMLQAYKIGATDEFLVHEYGHSVKTNNLYSPVMATHRR